MPKLYSTLLLLPAMLAGCVSIPTAIYPNHNLAPTYGTITHSPALLQTALVNAHGNITASVLDTTCRGYVAEAPDLSINNSTLAGLIPLNVSVTASGDTVLVVRTPDGRWLCDDDSAGSRNPAIQINGPVNGRYDVWVGTFLPGGFLNATLRVF